MDEILQEIVAFRDDRNWAQYHNPKDLALALSVEAGELLEHFQWKTSDQAVAERGRWLKDELGDVLIYALLLCHELHLDPLETIQAKLAKNASKYPVDKSYGSSKKYNEL